MTPNEIFKRKIAHLLNAEKSLDRKVRTFQNKMYRLIASEFMPKFALDKDGNIINSLANNRLINRLDNYFDRLENIMFRDVLSPFFKSILKGVSLSAEYYTALGFNKTVILEIVKNKIRLEEKLGITPKGRLRKNGYLYQLGKTQQVRQTLKNYVINSLNGGTSFLNFQLGFRNLVIGNRRQKGLATTGVLQRYFDQFAYDSFNQVDAVANRQFASSLNLKHFIYEGSVIDTTRAFCKKRAGKVFTVEDTKTWKNDPTLIDKKTKEAYNPLIERGRYRCRHFIKYITESLYNELK